MELKQNQTGCSTVDLKVLIVPSGIETQYVHIDHFRYVVLIVPSGIETRKSILVDSCLLVLIVPSGIETFKYLLSS